MRNKGHEFPVPIACQPMKVTPIVSELELFRQQQRELGSCPVQRPYDWHQKNARIYRVIFLGLAFIFMGLSGWIVLQQSNWFALWVFGHSLEIKVLLCALCGGFSTAAGVIALGIRAEKEAVYHFWKRYSRKLQRLYLRRRAVFGFRKWLFAGDEIAVLKHGYHEAVEKLHELKEGTLLLMEQVAQASELDRARRIHLFNEAVLELRERLSSVVGTFRRLEPN